MKTSTEESTRLLAAVLQQQLREVGIALDIRTFEFATFLRGRDQRRLPDPFVALGRRQSGSRTSSSTSSLPPALLPSAPIAPSTPTRAWTTLIREGRSTLDQQKRKAIYDEIQQILAEDLPYINLWYLDNVLVHTNRVRGIELGPAGKL